MGFKECFILFLLVSIVFFPTYAGGMGLAAGQKVLYVFYPLLLVGLFLCFKNKIKFLLPNSAVVIFIAFCIFVFSLISKLEFINTQILLGHFRYLAYFSIFLLTYNLAVNFNITLENLYLPIIYVGLLVIVFVIAQLIAPEVILKLGITNREAIGRLGFRIGGPLVWSYSLGFILLPVVFLVFTNMFKGIASKGLWLFFTLLILIVLAGQSKAAYLAYMTNFLLFCYLGFKYGRGKTMLSIFVLLILFLSMLIAYVVANLEDFGNIERFVSSITSNANDASTQTRLNQLSYIALTLDNNPYLGYPLEYVIIENGYGYYLYNYGLLGLLTYLGVLMYFFYKAWVSVKLVNIPSYDQRGKSVSLSYLSLVLGAVVFSLANSPLDGHKVAYFFWTLSGLYYGAIYSTPVQTNFNK